MNSNRPYLLRAFYEWIVDNDLTPYILVRADAPDVFLPPDIADEENNVYLNVGPSACMGLDMSNEAFSFSARFAGISFDCYIPVEAIKAICSRENGRGMVFPDDDDDFDDPPPPSGPSDDKPAPEPSKKKPTLTVVK